MTENDEKWAETVLIRCNESEKGDGSFVKGAKGSGRQERRVAAAVLSTSQ